MNNETDQVLRQFYQGEYETWQLVNEIISAEKHYFEKSSEARASSVCPKTLEYETLVSDHAVGIVHAVALWLEKIYYEDSKNQIQQFNINQNAMRVDYDDLKAINPDL